MGVLSLLCCSASSDDGEDKYLTRNQNETQNQSSTQTKQPEQSKNSQQLKQSPQQSLSSSSQKTQLAANNNNSPATNQNNKQPTSHKASLTALAPAPQSTSTSQSAPTPTTTTPTATTPNNATSNGSANVSRDKLHSNGVSKTNSAANNHANVNETVPLKKKNLLDEDDDDDDPSIHETDTITNTNGDSTNNTPKSYTNNADLTSDVLAKEQKLKQAKQNPDAVSAGDVIAQVSPNEQPPPKPTNLSAGSNSNNNNNNNNNNNGNQIDTDVDEYSDDDDEEEVGNGARDDVSYKSETSTLDLTRLQTGQAYNQETGYLLGPKPPKLQHRKCLILDLDETLVHSSFKYLRTADFVIPVEIDNQVHHVYVIKRPGVDEFLRKVGQWYEVVIFTASVSKYGDPLLNKLDSGNSAIHHRLFRDSCYNYQGNFIKNLSQVGRPLEDIIIIDNSPASYIFHPDHSIPISSWFSDSHDNELLDLLPFLEDLAKPNVDDVALVLDISL